MRGLHGDVVETAEHHGRDVLHVDKLLHINWAEPMNHWLVHHEWLGNILAGYYVVMHLGMTALTLVILWVNGRRYRYHRDALVLMSLVGLGIYWLYPTAPPRLLDAGFHDTVAATLPFAYQVETANANLYAAMPSLHMAWAVWVAIALWSITTRRWLRALAVLHPVLTVATVLATGNHYTTDLLAGVALASIGYLLYEAVRRLLAGRRWVATGTPQERSGTAGS